jgi:hypothetical protein
VGLIANFTEFGIMAPGIGAVFSFLSMFGIVIWDLLLARRFFQMARRTVV